MTTAANDEWELAITLAYPEGSKRNRMHVCIHCTNAVHETRACCTFCGHEVNTVREKCLCGACLREPRGES
jgi:predicted amidophosphoribosyltransferase